MNILLGRQSILDKNQNIVAYELLFRSTDQTPIDCDTEATASVIASTLSMMSIDNVLGKKRGFINIGIDILRQGLLDIIPANRFVIEILETQKPSPELLLFIKRFKHNQYIFALDDFIINREQLEYWTPILKEVHIVKVDVLDTSIEDLKQKTKFLKQFNVSLLAEKVETHEMFVLCSKLGYEYFQGYFFTKPIIIEGQDLSPSTQGIFTVIRQLQQDADIVDIEKTIKLYPMLIISLLKIVNSSSVSPVQEITSIKQAIALLGKKALTQWLLLLLYSHKISSNPHKAIKDDPLFLMAAQRGKMMEYFFTHSTQNASRSLKDEAFLIGLLSLADALLNMSMESVAQELHLSQTITEALLSQKGQLGELLRLVKYFEIFDIKMIQTYANRLNVTTEVINQAAHLSLKFSKELADNF